MKGSRVCEPCNVLAVRKYIRASMVSGYMVMTKRNRFFLENVFLLINEQKTGVNRFFVKSFFC